MNESPLKGSPLVIVGGGRMGDALVGGLIRAGVSPSSLSVAETSSKRRDELRASYAGIEVGDTPPPCDSGVLAVKPADALTAARALSDAGASRILSIVAGATTTSLEGVVSPGSRVVRAMPNMPALVGAGATAISPGKNVEEDDLVWAEELLRAVGIVVRVPESSMDAVTGLSGSGPAYLFLVAEAMVEAGVLLGLTRDAAETLVSQTLLGSGLLLAGGDQGGTGDLGDLRAAVTSPGGTTAVGLLELERRGVRAGILEAVAAAAERSAELSTDPSDA